MKLMDEVMDAVDMILWLPLGSREISKLRFETLYRHVYNLVAHGYGGMAYQALESKFRELAAKTYRRDDFNTVEKNNRLVMITDVFMYMRRNYMSAEDSIVNMAKRVYDERAAYRISVMERVRRTVSLIGKFAIALNVIYDEVAFRPEHSGAKRAREEFEALTHKHDTKRRCVESNEL
jgi:hypothetical protein